MVEDRFNHCDVWDNEFAVRYPDDFPFSPMRSGEDMYIVDLRLHCSKTFSEVQVDDVEQTELAVESIVSTALLEIFDTVHIEKVTVHYPPTSSDRNGDGNNGPLPDACP